MKHRVEGEDITLIGHSHGGNVAILAIPMLHAALEKANASEVKINLVTIATPTVNNPLSEENPDNVKGLIFDHIHIYNDKDKVQTKLANAVDQETYGRTYQNQKTQNVQLDVSKDFPELSVEAHGIDIEKPEIIKKNIDNGVIPKIRKE